MQFRDKEVEKAFSVEYWYNLLKKPWIEGKYEPKNDEEDEENKAFTEIAPLCQRCVYLSKTQENDYYCSFDDRFGEKSQSYEIPYEARSECPGFREKED